MCGSRFSGLAALCFQFVSVFCVHCSHHALHSHPYSHCETCISSHVLPPCSPCTACQIIGTVQSFSTQHLWVHPVYMFIFRRFFLKTQLAIPDELRKEVNRHIKEGKDLLAGNVFDGVQAEVENLINETTYPNFLKSDMYLQHIQVMQNGELSLGSTSSSSSSSGSSSGGGRDLSHGGPPLPTLYEDIEFVTEMGNSGCSKLPAIGNDVLPLTRDMLIATQKKRASELRPKPEAYVRYVACSCLFFHKCV